MIWFWVMTAILLVIVVGSLLAPLMRTPAEKPRYVAVLATGAGLPVFALGVYLTIGQWQTPEVADQTAPDVEAMVGQLAARLQREGGNEEEWRMLGRSYMVMGRYPDAVSAFGQARKVSTADDPELLAQFAEALALTDLDNLRGEAGALFEQVLARRPRDPKGLWYGAAAAEARGDSTLAIERWQLLLTMNPPDALRQVLEARLRDAGGSVPASMANNEPVSTIEVAVSLDPELSAGLAADTPVFVIARTAEGGPPLAVRRLRLADLPAQVTLSEADAMLPERSIGNQTVAELTARVAISGGPVAQPGDLFASQAVTDATVDGPVVLRIDRRVQ